MNERIRELAEQAGYTPLEPRTFADDLQEIFLQKFAQLIVEDIMQELFINGYEDAFDHLNKYFGVD